MPHPSVGTSLDDGLTTMRTDVDRERTRQGARLTTGESRSRRTSTPVRERRSATARRGSPPHVRPRPTRTLPLPRPAQRRSPPAGCRDPPRTRADCASSAGGRAVPAQRRCPVPRRKRASRPNRCRAKAPRAKSAIAAADTSSRRSRPCAPTIVGQRADPRLIPRMDIPGAGPVRGDPGRGSLSVAV
jgi:hypothetical protein